MMECQRREGGEGKACNLDSKKQLHTDYLNQYAGLAAILHNILKRMSKQIENAERKYRKITFQQRQQLISLVIEQKKKIADAARQVKINPSTARIIIQNYKEEGRIYEKRSERLERRQKEVNEPAKPDESQTEEKQQKRLNTVPSVPLLNYVPFFEAQVPIYFQWFPYPY